MCVAYYMMRGRKERKKDIYTYSKLLHSWITYGAPTTTVPPSSEIATEEPNLDATESGAMITSVLKQPCRQKKTPTKRMQLQFVEEKKKAKEY